jgi:hypothetical protein
MWWIIGITVLVLFMFSTWSMNRDADKKVAKRIMQEEENQEEENKAKP